MMGVGGAGVRVCPYHMMVWEGRAVYVPLQHDH